MFKNQIDYFLKFLPERNQNDQIKSVLMKLLEQQDFIRKLLNFHIRYFQELLENKIEKDVVLKKLSKLIIIAVGEEISEILFLFITKKYEFKSLYSGFKDDKDCLTYELSINFDEKNVKERELIRSELQEIYPSVKITVRHGHVQLL